MLFSPFSKKLSTMKIFTMCWMWIVEGRSCLFPCMICIAVNENFLPKVGFYIRRDRGTERSHIHFDPSLCSGPINKMGKYRTAQKSYSIHQKNGIRLRVILKCFLKICARFIYFFHKLATRKRIGKRNGWDRVIMTSKEL